MITPIYSGFEKENKNINRTNQSPLKHKPESEIKNLECPTNINPGNPEETTYGLFDALSSLNHFIGNNIVRPFKISVIMAGGIAGGFFISKLAGQLAGQFGVNGQVDLSEIDLNIGRVAYWPLNDTNFGYPGLDNFEIVKDLSGNDNHGILNDGVEKNKFGVHVDKFGNINCGNGSSLNFKDSDFSFSVWLNVSETKALDSSPTIFGKSDDEGFEMGIRPTGKVEIIVGKRNSLILSNVDIVNGNYNHVVFSYESSNHIGTLTINNILDTTSYLSYSGSLSNSHSFCIGNGCSFKDRGDEEGITMDVSQLSLYNVELDANKINKLYKRDVDRLTETVNNTVTTSDPKEKDGIPTGLIIFLVFASLGFLLMVLVAFLVCYQTSKQNNETDKYNDKTKIITDKDKPNDKTQYIKPDDADTDDESSTSEIELQISDLQNPTKN